MELVLQRTIKRVHIIKEFSFENNIDDKNILVTFRKHLYFLKCGILKL